MAPWRRHEDLVVGVTVLGVAVERSVATSRDSQALGSQTGADLALAHAADTPMMLPTR